MFFDAADRVEYIEVSRGQASFAAIYKGLDVFASNADDVIAAVSREASVDEDDAEFPYSYVFPPLELSLWRASLPEGSHGGHFDAIGIGRSGYFSGRPRQRKS